MAIVYQVLRSVTRYNASGQILPETPATASANVTGGNELELSTAVPAGSTNLLIAASVAVSTSRVVVVSSDVAMTVKVNSSGSPTATITLVAGVPQIWATGDAGSNPLGATAVTALYATNAGSVDGTLTLFALNP